MTPEESQIIRSVFARIRSNGPVMRDDQARTAIETELRANPDAGLGLIQMLVSLDQQLQQVEAERDQLVAQLNEQRGNQPRSGGGLFGRSSVPSYSQQSSYNSPPPPPPAAGPWGAPQQSSPWGAPQAPLAGGGFLRTALGSAAGMAGGLFAFEALRDVFGGHSGGGMFGGGSGGGVTEIFNNTTVVDDKSPFSPYGDAPSDNSGGFDTSSDDGDSFGGGGDDSSFG